MSIHSFSELGALFSNQSKGIWERLGYVRDSFKIRGVLGPVRFGEETITDLLMMELYIQGSTVGSPYGNRNRTINTTTTTKSPNNPPQPIIVHFNPLP